MNLGDIQVVYRPISDVIPYARNPRKHDHAVDRMCASIQEFGFRIPILTKSDGTIIDGHLRLLAAQKLALSEVPTISCDEWSDAQVKAFRLLANRSVAWAEWDEGLLKLELEDLKAFDFDLGLTGFDPDELEAYLAPTTPGLTDPDSVPELPELPVVVPGDVWLLGKHRLLCGDATIGADVDRLLAGIEPLLMVTDPPYGVEYDPAWRNKVLIPAHRREGTISNDNCLDWSDAYSLFPGDIAYVWHASLYASAIQQSLEGATFELRSQIIWAKLRFAISRGHYHWQHEACWYAVRKGATGNWCGDRSQTTLWRIESTLGDEAKNDHASQKPVECMRRPIVNHTNRGQSVYDPFVGTGTTIIAAEQTGRACFALDIDPLYVDVAVKRWQDFTGRKATLEGDGRSFEEIAADRLAGGVMPVVQDGDLRADLASYEEV